MQLCLGVNVFDIGLCIMLWLTLVSRDTAHTFWPFVKAQVGIFMICKYTIEASTEPVHSSTSELHSKIERILFNIFVIGVRETAVTMFIEKVAPDGDLHQYISGLGILCNFF